MAQKKYDETGSVKEANDAYQGYIDQLRIALTNAGMTKSAVDELIQKIAQMPQYKATTFAITADASAYWRTYGEILAARYQRWGGVTTHAATGALREAATFAEVASPVRVRRAGHPGRSVRAQVRQLWPVHVHPQHRRRLVRSHRATGQCRVERGRRGDRLRPARRGHVPVQLRGIAVMDGQQIGALVSDYQTDQAYARPRL